MSGFFLRHVFPHLKEECFLLYLLYHQSIQRENTAIIDIANITLDLSSLLICLNLTFFFKKTYFLKPFEDFTNFIFILLSILVKYLVKFYVSFLIYNLIQQCFYKTIPTSKK